MPGRMFSVLAENGINIDMIATSGLRISCIVERKHINDAVRALYKAFNVNMNNSE
ncbi:MAG: ACT domain-containing protein [Synergistetes bacterium]|nr:ACT domain-containing protein [Synergistota bacterium]